MATGAAGSTGDLSGAPVSPVTRAASVPADKGSLGANVAGVPGKRPSAVTSLIWALAQDWRVPLPDAGAASSAKQKVMATRRRIAESASAIASRCFSEA